MGDFIAYAEDEEAGLDVLVHFGILGQKHGQRNGPPYPLGSGDHSAKEKKAASAAGVKVGSDSGKGSIDNVKKKKSTRSKSPKKPLTPEEKREQAMAAARSGDKKKIAKNIDELSTDELRDAAERARLKEQLTKKDENPGEKKMSKEDLAKQEAMRSGDKEQIKLYADKMSNEELVQALNRVELNQKLNYVDPGPSALDRVQKIANAVDKMRDAAEKGIKAYNVAAQVYNSTHKGEGQWPIIGPQNKDNKDGDKKDKDKDDTKKAVEQIAKEVKKSYEEQRKEKYENQKTDYEYDKKFEKWKKKQEEKEAAKEEKKKKKEQGEEKPEEKEEPKEKPKEQPEEKPEVVDWEGIWNSVEDAKKDGRPITDDLTPEEEAYLNSFLKGR